MYATRFFTLASALSLVFATLGWAQLPSESRLPGEEAPQPDLPAESELPSYAAWQTQGGGEVEAPAADASGQAAADENQQPGENPPDAEPTAEPPRALPDEHDLPAADAAQSADPGAAAAAEEALPIKGSPDGIPWLRLNRPGHTAPLRAMTFSADGERLTTAGDDKSLVVWSQAPVPAGAANRWIYERTVRWQIQRGTRGRLYAVAAAPQWIAMAGEGAMGGAGEILLIDPVTGELSAVLNDVDQAHRQVVVSLDFSPEAATLASLGLDGSVVQWTKTPEGLWKPARLSGPDDQTFVNDPPLVQRLLTGRALSAIAAINEREVIAPAYGSTQNNRLVWQLQRYSPGNDPQPLAAGGQDAPHWDFVTALAADARGQRLASADGGGNVYLWDLSTPRATLHRFPAMSAQVISLSFDDQGKTLAVGTAVASNSRRASIEVWDVSNLRAPRRLTSGAAENPIMACGVSPDGRTFAWADGARSHVASVGGGAQQTLAAGATPPVRVAFPVKAPYYRLGIGKQRGPQQAAAVDHVFDTELLKLQRLNRPAAADWLPADWLSKGWQVRAGADQSGRQTTWLYEGPQRRARIPLDEIRDGAYRTVCWIPGRGEGAPPAAAAIGTTSGEIFVYGLANDGAAPLMRRFRGHSAEVTSLAVSLDLRYLASASLDGAVAVWPLSGLTRDGALIQRWGIDVEELDGRLTVKEARPNGPAYFRGLRPGDQIVELRYRVDNQDRVAETPQEIRAALAEVDYQTLVQFWYVRGRAPRQSFQILPAYQQVVSLFVADDGEWAYWTPAGFYDASFEGHKLFGWQINRGLEMLPDFFLAAQFRRQLERPKAMSQLLRAGDLEAAFQAARLNAPANSADALVNSYRLKPEVQILSPREGAEVADEVKLQARLSVDVAERLAPPKAFANGVAAGGRRLIAESVAEGRRHYTYEWDCRLPSDPRLLLQVVAATENEVTGGDQIVVKRQPSSPARRPRLFLLSVGVDGYRDTQIPKLTTAVRTTEELRQLLESRAGDLYDLSAVSLLDDRATKPSWRAMTEDLAAKLQQGVSPDDMLVIFLSGHGIQARGEAGYQFVTADARYADVLGERYGDCLSMSDLSQFADIPCRKLVILNTCHGGAMPSLFHRELKSAVRALQDDLLLTLSASGGEQEAVEGRFAKRLLEALGGAADSDGDGVVSFAETVGYVEQKVAADSSGDAVRQTPSAGPKELLPYATAPLTVRAKALTARAN